MPRVYLSENERLCDHLATWVYGRMKCRGISQREMAAEMGITQQALSVKLKMCRFTFEDLLTFVRVLDPDDRELVGLFGRR